MATNTNARGQRVRVTNWDEASITATLSGGDIEIGQVELKDSDSTAEANIKAANTARTTATNVIAVQHVDATGAVLPASPVLGAGSAIVGNFRIDQTTPGTTNRIVAAGTAVDNAAASGNPVQVGGVAVTVASYAPGYTAGDQTVLPCDKDSGGVLCHTRALTRAGDAVSADPKQCSTVSTATPATADATVFTLAAGEKGVIQNLSADAPLAYKLGASASTSSFNGVLACGVSADDGKGDIVVIDDFAGAVSVAKISGTARYIAFKLS